MDWVNVSRMALAWARGSDVVHYAPKEVAIEPTNVCNYRCTFCPQSNPEHQKMPSGLMSLENLDTILARLVEAKAAWNDVISFTHDGEPLLHPQFHEFIRRANLHGFKPRFSSNGSRLTPVKADMLAAGGYFRASIDFSGSQEIFEAYRGKPGHWQLVRDNIAYLIELSNRNPKVGLEVTEMGGYQTPENSEELLSRLRSVLPTPTSSRVEFRIRVFHNAAGTVQLRRSASAERVYRRCPYPWSSMNIAWDGEIHACCRDLEGRTRLGNILQVDSLWTLWNGEPYRNFRRLIASRQPDKVAACAGCDLPWSADSPKWSAKQIYWRLKNV